MLRHYADKAAVWLAANEEGILIRVHKHYHNIEFWQREVDRRDAFCNGLRQITVASVAAAGPDFLPLIPLLQSCLLMLALSA